MLPSFLKSLTKLQVLNVRDNPLKKVEFDLGVLKELVYLNLSKLELDEVPSQIGELEKLEKLHLYRCGNEREFEMLPFSFARLQNLKVLDIQVPGLKQLPDCLGKFAIPISLCPICFQLLH